MSVRRSLTSVNNKMSLSEPKTERGKRCIALDIHTVAALKNHKARQAQERLAAGPAYQEHDYVFAGELGQPIEPDRFSKVFIKLVHESGLPRIRLHDLRHTSATLALRKGIHPKVVSERLGHSSIAITLDVYSHAVPALQQDAADQLAELIFGA